MLPTAKIALFVSVFLFFLTPPFENPAGPSQVPAYTGDGRLQLPEHYREWVYLTSGFDMRYDPSAQNGDQHVFDNVFVNPASYQAFLKTGTWPDHTTLVLEFRDGLGKGSINQKGNYQGTVQGLDVHVKDEARFPDKWAFFEFSGGKTGKLFPTSADCYSCHAAHAAVDTTFVQFYPTLLPIANSKGTLSPAYQKESASQAQK
jgi:hypothetical protein